MKDHISDGIAQSYSRIVKWFERLLALCVLIGVIAHTIFSGIVLSGMDWRLTVTFYDLVYRVLLLVIGLELVRMLVVHDLMAILELLAFVIARKMLKPDIVALDIVLAVIAFVALLAARRYLLTVPTLSSKKLGDAEVQTYPGKRD
jgi:hypothetical protein